jgi:hypothetical protein
MQVAFCEISTERSLIGYGQAKKEEWIASGSAGGRINIWGICIMWLPEKGAYPC